MALRSDHFQALVATHPDNELFRFSLAQALVIEGRPDDAITHFEACVSKKTDWMMPRILLGKIRLARGERLQARELFAAALNLAISQNHEDPERELRSLLADLAS